MDKRLVVSTIGLSALINVASEKELRDEINRNSNAEILENELELEISENLVSKIEQCFNSGDPAAIKKLSAELNGLYGFYDDNMERGKNDLHFLISTDTALGKKAADLIKEFLEQKLGWNQVQVFSPHKLSTSSTQNFSAGMQNLLKWCEDTLPGFKESGYRVVFNLTGGFKSLQGYLNIVGMFYADEICYIFETASTLLRIPRLPIEIDRHPIQMYAAQLEMINVGFPQPISGLSGLPEGLLETDNSGDAMMSEWGFLIWNRLRGQILSETLLNFPNLVYLDTFKKDFANAEKTNTIRLQETLAKVAAMFAESKGDTALLKKDGGLQYDNFSGKQDGGKPVGHFRVSQGIRVSCHVQNGNLYLRHFGEHDYVNNNP